jgi:hypothetical protein
MNSPATCSLCCDLRGPTNDSVFSASGRERFPAALMVGMLGLILSPAFFWQLLHICYIIGLENKKRT